MHGPLNVKCIHPQASSRFEMSTFNNKSFYERNYFLLFRLNLGIYVAQVSNSGCALRGTLIKFLAYF